MSNSLAVAMVTASLKNVLQSAFNSSAPDHVAGADVTTLSPADRAASSKGANIFLYRVSPNVALRNMDLPARNSSGLTVDPPKIALDLHYLLSFYGSDPSLEPQRLLGIAVRTLHAQPVLSRRIVAQSVQTAASPGSGTEFLGSSDLADGPALVRFTPAEISLEELSKLWSILLQTKYVLSVLYVASVVVIDSPEAGVAALPVLQPNVSVQPIRPLLLDRVIAAGVNPGAPIVGGSTIAVLGRGLSTAGLRVSIDGVLLDATFVVQNDTRLEFVLPASLPAGARGLRVASFRAASALPTYESNFVTFPLRPILGGPIVKAVRASTPQGVDGTLTVGVSPRAGARQRIALLLNQKVAALNSPPAAPASGVELSLSPAAADDTSDSASLTFSFRSLDAGTYSVRLRVDGAESPPQLLGSPPALGPEVTLP